MRTVVAASILALLSACTFTPHGVAVNPQAPVARSSIGEGVTVALAVRDDRDSDVVGQRGAAMIGSDITAPNVLPALGEELAAGLEGKGFNVVPHDSPADVELDARLRSFAFFNQYGFFTGGHNANVAVAVEAERGAEDFERMYRADDEDRALFVASGSKIDDQLSAALSNVLAQILSDDDLLRFLAASPIR